TAFSACAPSPTAPAGRRPGGRAEEAPRPIADGKVTRPPSAALPPAAAVSASPAASARPQTRPHSPPPGRDPPATGGPPRAMPAQGWPLRQVMTRLTTLLYIPDAFLLPRTILSDRADIKRAE